MSQSKRGLEEEGRGEGVVIQTLSFFGGKVVHSVGVQREG